MLELKNIYKSYTLFENKQDVLKNVSLSFRNFEFVSILGASGSGKTTLLNIISGLDSYDSGDLLFNNTSTSKFDSSDWDAYRNHKIGFVFQNYNLINHLSILDNVKLALVISGLSKKDIIDKSIESLKRVGLLEHINKKPNQLSGGQMQRVAIARALVNNPDIIVADEPTGALDSNTSLEIMNILKDISKEKLVIMVTHNIDLANKYSTRVIRIDDGKIIDDTNPYKATKIIKNKINEKNKKMSFFSSLQLSLRNLLTKKKRTILTSFACSIGIIGIALVLSLTNGVNKYIKDVEVTSINDYPIIIERKTYDLFGYINVPKSICNKNKICVTSDKNSSVIENNIKDFKNYVDINNEFTKYTSDIVSSYDIDLNVYNNNYEKVNKDSFKEINLVDYEIIFGRMPNKYNELAIVVDKNNYISKDLVSSLNINNVNKGNYSYNEIINNSLKLVINTDYYKKENSVYIDYSLDNEYIKNFVDNGLDLKIVGIIKNSDTNTSFIGYTDKLNKYLIDNISKSEIYKDQINNKNINVITNAFFDNITNSYEDLEKSLGMYDLNNPSRISIYPKDYKAKEKIISLINEYNKKQSNKDKIKYSDMMRSLVDSISKILNIISKILIFFAGISLVVSSIMISIITYISVLERTKEIGILRAIGASKKDIKRIFNAETIIEGLVAGIIGIIITLFINIIINIIVKSLFNIKNISVLSINNIVFLIFLSVLINALSGLKPAIVASKKNPVEALRCE